MVVQLLPTVVIMMLATIMMMVVPTSIRAVHGFMTVPSNVGLSFGIPIKTTTVPSSSTRLWGGGFGGTSSDSSGSGGGNKKKGKGGGGGGSGSPSLKPKQQWDRYIAFKKEDKVRVAVRCKGDGESDEWLEVGRVKSKDNAYTEVAVAIQRAIIAEHARRLYPLQISPKKILEWAYYQDEKEKWTVIDKSILTEKPSEEGTTTSTPVKLDGIEKLIGFEGRPDPASGYYCVYDGGRLQRDKVQSYFKESYYKEQD